MVTGASPAGALAGALLACAALCWPSAPRRPVPPSGAGQPGRSFLGRSFPGRSGRGRTGQRLSFPALVFGGLAGASALIAAAVLAGPAGLLATAMLGATATALVRGLLAERRRHRALPDILRGLRTLNRELRSGSEPAAAVDAAGRTSGRAGARVLSRLAVLMRADGGPGGPLVPDGGPGGRPTEAEDRALAVLRSGWLLCRQHGVAFGRVVSGIADGLADDVAAEQARAAQLAGPRLSGYVLAGLPLMGVLLGAGMGVNPIGVLFGSSVGHLLLLVGVALMCAGLLWSARIVGR